MGVLTLADFMQQSVANCREVMPESWFDTLQKLQKLKGQGKGMILFDEVEGIYSTYKAIHEDMQFSPTWLSAENNNCQGFLHYLHNAGMVLWFSNSKILKNSVLHDREFLVHILQHIFHHNLRETLKYNPAKPYISNITEFNEHLDNFLDCGILSEPLLQHIWDGTEAKENKELMEYIVELLQSLNLCFQLKDSDRNAWCFPWFVKEKVHDEFLLKEWPITPKESEIAIELCYKFCHQLPLMLYEHFSVAMQRNLHLGDPRHDWKDIIYIRSNGVQMKIQRYPYEEYPSIQVALRTQVSNIQAMYELCLQVNVDLQMLLHTYPGVVYDSYLVCPHCLLIGAQNKKHWNLSLIENYAEQDWMTCSASTPAVDIPSALVYFTTLGILYYIVACQTHPALVK